MPYFFENLLDHIFVFPSSLNEMDHIYPLKHTHTQIDFVCVCVSESCAYKKVYVLKQFLFLGKKFHMLALSSLVQKRNK